MNVGIKVKELYGGINPKRKKELAPVLGMHPSMGSALIGLTKVNINLEKSDQNHRYVLVNEDICIKEVPNKDPGFALARMYVR